MNSHNVTMITEILLLGFRSHHGLSLLIFLTLLVVYCLTVCGNFLIITLIWLSSHLHSPMYLFLSQLSVTDVMLTTNISPNTLRVVMNEGADVSLEGCMTQFYFFGVTECSECLLLTAMSYDRYLAICKPLRYSSLMSLVLCVRLTVLSWLISSLLILIPTVTAANVDFCGPNIIDHFFCDLGPLLEILCSKSSLIRTEVALLCIPTLIIPFTVVTVSYSCIVFAILQIQSDAGRRKAFSTCSSHLCVVSIYFGTLFCMYVLSPQGQSLVVSKILSLSYTVVTPLLNPIIYTLRNQDIKKAIREKLTKH